MTTKTTTTKPLHELVYMTAEEYELHIEAQYFRWCQNLSKGNDIKFQKIIANAPINKYYNDEFVKLQRMFVSIATPQFGKIPSRLIQKIYDTTTNQMFEKYPQALIEKALKINIHNN
jgi:hypothetical protein